MPRMTRKRIVGKIENAERALSEEALRDLTRELHADWWRDHSPEPLVDRLESHTSDDRAA